MTQDTTKPTDAEIDAAMIEWHAEMPDFLKPEDPPDIPHSRLPFARAALTGIGAPLFCPDLTCRRAHECRGGEGPPCYRADRQALRQALFMAWATMFRGMSRDCYTVSLRGLGNRYAPGEPITPPPPVPARRRVAKRRR